MIPLRYFFSLFLTKPYKDQAKFVNEIVDFPKDVCTTLCNYTKENLAY